MLTSIDSPNNIRGAFDFTPRTDDDSTSESRQGDSPPPAAAIVPMSRGGTPALLASIRREFARAANCCRRGDEAMSPPYTSACHRAAFLDGTAPRRPATLAALQTHALAVSRYGALETFSRSISSTSIDVLAPLKADLPVRLFASKPMPNIPVLTRSGIASLEHMSMGRRYALNTSALLLVKALAKSSVKANSLGGQTPAACLARVVNAADCYDRAVGKGKLEFAINYALRSCTRDELVQAHDFFKRQSVELPQRCTNLTRDDVNDFVTAMQAALKQAVDPAPSRKRRASDDCMARLVRDERTCDDVKLETLAMAMAMSN